MANVLVKDLSHYNQKVKLSNGDIVQFVGQFATISSTDAALLQKANSSEYVISPTIGSPALSSGVQALSTTEITKAKAVIVTNQVSGASGLSTGTKNANTAEIAKATAAFATNQETAGAQP